MIDLMDKQMNGWVGDNRQMDGWMDRWLVGWLGRWRGRHTIEWLGRKMVSGV